MKINKDSITLTHPSMKAFASYVEALEEGYVRGIQAPKTAQEIQEIKRNPEKHLHELNDNTPGEYETPSGEKFQKVPYEALWLTADDIFIGEVSFRHKLNEMLENFGGHIGYGIRPSLSGQGFATLALKLTKDRAAQIGIEKLLLTCSPNNPASERVITKNGGQFIGVSTKTYGYNEATRRYWVYTRN
ncbi:MAG: GNAT family N-acetyltransferase [Alphaproteobacteria bacterium]|nr:GNAT family N-acetyltransferase [Alphaproteobacteria bacterium]